jgi:LysM repeat protein
MKKTFLFVLLLTWLLPAAPARAEAPLVDTSAYSLIAEVNALRAQNGLPAYAVNSILMSTAQAHAEYMAATGNVSHTGAGGTTSSQRIQAAGYPLAGDLSLGGFKSENITSGVNKSVQQAVLDWQGDAPHLNTMLSPNLQEIGAGVAIVGETVYYVIDCARPTNSGLPQSYTPAPGTTPSSGEVDDVAPLASTVVPVTPNANGNIIHVVQPGETLWLIAISYGVKIAEIRALNGLTETTPIYPGEKLLIRKNVPTVPAATVSPASSAPRTAPAPTRTLAPLWVASPLPTLPLPTPTAPPAPVVSSDSSKLVLGAIVLAALVLAAVFVRAGRQQ